MPRVCLQAKRVTWDHGADSKPRPLVGQGLPNISCTGPDRTYFYVVNLESLWLLNSAIAAAAAWTNMCSHKVLLIKTGQWGRFGIWIIGLLTPVLENPVILLFLPPESPLICGCWPISSWEAFLPDRTVIDAPDSSPVLWSWCPSLGPGRSQLCPLSLGRPLGSQHV